MISQLSDSDLDTYARQIVLADIGYDGQLALRNSGVCLVGVGGLGSPAALKLAGMGVGRLRLVDRDIVSRSDLHRQYLYDAEAVGRPKVEVAAEKLKRLNPDVTLEPVAESLNSNNVADLFSGVDLVVDGLDRPEPRYLVNRTCREMNLPYVFGAAVSTYGNASTFVPGKSLCLECFMSGIGDDDLPSCGIVGVHPAVLGIVAAVQVSEAVRVLTGRKPALLGKILYVDLSELSFNLLDVPAERECTVCGELSSRKPFQVKDRFFEETCARDGRRNFIITPKQRIRIELTELAPVIEKTGAKIKFVGEKGITFTYLEDLTACVLDSGTLIAQTPPHMEKGYQAGVFSIYRKLMVDGLSLPPDLIPEV